jgi:5-methylcytosine-specific restriction endonuclease McrA
MAWPKPKGAVVRKAASFRRTASGVTKIRRDGYSTQNGMSVKNSWWEISAKVRKRSKGLCEDHASRGLKVKGVEVHHIVPLSKGGRTVLSNLIHLCEDCHDRRHNHLYRSRS